MDLLWAILRWMCSWGLLHFHSALTGGWQRSERKKQDCPCNWVHVPRNSAWFMKALSFTVDLNVIWVAPPAEFTPLQPMIGYFDAQSSDWLSRNGHRSLRKPSPGTLATGSGSTCMTTSYGSVRSFSCSDEVPTEVMLVTLSTSRCCIPCL